MDFNNSSQSLESPRARVKTEAASYIAQRRWDLYSHPAMEEAFRNVPAEVNPCHSIIHMEQRADNGL